MGSAPKPDPAIGEAAKKSAQIGQDTLAWMKSQAAITNKWAQEDRARYKNTFQPLEDRLVADATSWDTPQRRAQRVSQAEADVSLSSNLARRAQERQLRARGVNPASGAYASQLDKFGRATALARAGAGNVARRQVEAEGYARRGAAVNLGRGLAVNPATSMGMASNAMNAGFGAAQQGYNTQGRLLNMDYNQRMAAYNDSASTFGDILGAAGTLAGLAKGASILAISSKKVKTDKKPASKSLEAIKSMPVETWKYKPEAGMGGGKHIGPYAEDFKKATGTGDGKTIFLPDAIGLTMGAVKEVAQKVDTLAMQVDKLAKRGPRSIKQVAA